MENYKEKYEHALDNFKKIKDANKDNKELVAFIEYEYPELKESEDERIRKHLLKHFMAKTKEEWNGMPIKNIISWLEKQGELSVKLKFYKDLNKIHKKNHTETVRELIAEYKKECVEYANEGYWKGYKEGKQAVLDKYAELEKQAKQPNKVSIWKHWNNGIAGNGEGKLIYLIKSGNTYRLSSCLGFECDYIELSELDKLYVEKQGEQKPTDKVEPKFKVGDWIVSEYGNVNTVNQVIKVEPINDEYFSYTLDDKTYFDGSWENSYHLWTIQDANDGDVLATDNSGICIFDGTVEDGMYPFAYCGITERGFEVYDRTLPFTHANVQPATKEQLNLLFQKMKEAGYEWDGEKKELKKIEQKPAWSEEDNIEISVLINALGELETYGGDFSKEKIWLKSIKERMKGE